MFDTVSGDNVEFSFDGVDIIEGLQKMGDFFKNLPNYFPPFVKIGRILKHVWIVFPSDYWFALCIVLVCFTIMRVFCRRH